MKLTLDVPPATYVIQSYDRWQVLINNQRYTRSLVVMPEVLIIDWPPRYLQDLTVNHFQDLTQYHLDIIIIGTDEPLNFMNRTWVSSLEGRGIGVEIMNTGAACRTYNLLIAEKRQVAVALLKA